MNGSSGTLVQAIRGPLILIAVGTLFAVDHLTSIRFGQTWPALLILIGLLKLLERSLSRPKSQPDGMPQG